jgi:glycine/D-amino acid oxidase-like deaminating enzyme
MHRSGAEVCVMGAGLTGSIIALELARAGVGVVLLDQDERPLNRASLRNEGKIHLGFVFAGDPSFATASLMLDGALSFRSILRRLLADRVDAIGLSAPFTYLVAEDSMLAPAELSVRYSTIEHLYADKLRAQPNLDYLGRRPAALFRSARLAELSPQIRADRLIGAFRTEELAVDTVELARAARDALAASARIRFLPSHRITGVERTAEGFRVTGTGPGGTWEVASEQVVNALWENRFKIDRTLGVAHAPGWVHRLKYRVVARLSEQMRDGPSVTMVQGPYGDVVIRPDGTAYFSWYPRRMRGWTHALAPPDSWDAPCSGKVDAQTKVSIGESILAAIDRWYPGALQSEMLLGDAGAIVAYGLSDVDDPKSALHDRTRVGVTSTDGYHSVDPGKLTTAPWFGVLTARQVLGLSVSG